MSTERMTCPACGAELTFDPARTCKTADGRVACPYDGLRYAPLRAGHDQLYFGSWRKMEATSIDIRRAYLRLDRHLNALAQALEGRDLPAAHRDLAHAFDAYRSADPDDEGSELLRLMDHALSYAHRAIDDLLHEDGLPSHDPMDFGEWYDAVEVPFRDEW